MKNNKFWVGRYEILEQFQFRKMKLYLNGKIQFEICFGSFSIQFAIMMRKMVVNMSNNAVVYMNCKI